ncbi:MAG: iron-containing alcohol dehydrogenase [Chloroflexi bacterium]|nr:iron-containing alcohol dehydrogenase [Chloroflexota bacterium]
MWYFRSPLVVFGEDALSHLATLSGERAFVVTDSNMARLGLLEKVRNGLESAGMQVEAFTEVEIDPSLETVRRAADLARTFDPQVLVGLGGGSAMDSAKAVRVLMERPDMDATQINPVDSLGLSKDITLVTIPTTSGTGAEMSWAVVLTDRAANRKLVLGSPENMADVAIIDPEMSCGMPPWLTADTGLDVLVHAMEVYTSTWANDYIDAQQLLAIRLVFQYLPRAFADGSDLEAREKMANAAALAGFGLANGNITLAHCLAHSLGGQFHPPHGRTTGLLLPYTMEYTAGTNPARYVEIARFLGIDGDDRTVVQRLIQKVKDLLHALQEPATLQELGIDRVAFERALPDLIDNAQNDAGMLASVRVPDMEDVRKLYLYAYEGRIVDF